MKTLLSILFCLISLVTVSAQVDTAQVVLKNILSRYSVRGYESTPIESEKVEMLLRAAMAAPTDMNMQPWHFVVLTSEEDRTAYVEDMGRSGNRIKSAPLLVVVCGDTTRMQQGEPRDMWIMDCSAATENMLLMAHALGLGAVWTTVYPLSANVARVQKNLNLPGNLIPMATVCVGYPRKGGAPARPAGGEGGRPAGGVGEGGAQPRPAHPAAGPKDKWDATKVSYGRF